ncbi:MAG: hypothetical protein KAQ90_03650 [Melioribacteraceae bacterium]|nr:hypothetical protein [Melioribacteraceae bacterium]
MSRHLDKYINLLTKLKTDTSPKWGKMSAQHMIEHLILAVQNGNGKLKLECFNPPEKLPVLKRYLLSGRTLPQGFVNPYIGDDLQPLIFTNLEESINELKNEVEDYYSFFESDPDATITNITFGPLNKSEWEVFHDKHFTHHLTQFGLF